jgi:hypothetical protein
MELPNQFGGKPKIQALCRAFERQLDAISDMLSVLAARCLNTATGEQLDGYGDIIGLRRLTEQDDEYRLLLKFRALSNTYDSTFAGLTASLELLYNARFIIYKEHPEEPARMRVMVGAQFRDHENVTSLLVRPAGVAADITFFNTEFFGFRDVNRHSLGFGVGEFARNIL